MPSGNKALIRRLFAEVWNKGNLRVAGEIFSYDYIMHDPNIKHEPGIQSYEHHVTQVRATFPDIKFTIEDLVEEGNKVVVRWKAEGTHKAEFLGVPDTGKRVTVTGVTVTRISGGKVAESWANWNALGVMQQLGVNVHQTAGSGLW